MVRGRREPLAKAGERSRFAVIGVDLLALVAMGVPQHWEFFSSSGGGLRACLLLLREAAGAGVKVFGSCLFCSPPRPPCILVEICAVATAFSPPGGALASL